MSCHLCAHLETPVRVYVPRSMDRLHILSAMSICFARGVNDAPKLAALLIAGVGASARTLDSRTPRNEQMGFARHHWYDPAMKTPPDADTIIAHTRCWIERVVIELNLCPFARKPFEAGQVRFVVSAADQPEALLADLHSELEFLRAADAAEVETTVLIHPFVLNNFLDYNDFLGVVDALIAEEGYEGEFQVASFHPDYQFAGTMADDAENYTNRSPYPTLHLLREEGLARAIDGYARPDKIPERNIRTLEKAGTEHMRDLLGKCTRGEK